MPKKKDKKTYKEEFVIDSDKLVETVKKLIKEGNARRVIIKNEKGKTMIEVPVTIGAVGAILVPVIAAIGALAALVSRCKIIVEKYEK